MTFHQQLLIQILFFVTTATAAAVFERNFTRPYVVKKTWVENFVQFQYIFEGKSAKPKIVPLGVFVKVPGCVPTNRDDGELLKVGGRFFGADFVYACEQSEDGVVSYDAVGEFQ
ncbi:unnamed protein product [Nippostrongylus brasiliensis]|uniref:Peptidase S1 domain-containing protein n=1 Tax=Nippostrongylus brasiliensis TaxID=27835 RepID=A0A0N4Y6Z5_NIPBR|nr:unnamed protein product [Nippostrongylus brasiliensis]